MENRNDKPKIDLEEILHQNETFIGTKKNEVKCERFESLKELVLRAAKAYDMSPYHYGTVDVDIDEPSPDHRNAHIYLTFNSEITTFSGDERIFGIAFASADRVTFVYITEGACKGCIGITYSVDGTWE